MINRRTAPGFAALLSALLICHGAQALSPEQRYRQLDAKKAETNWITAKANADHFLGMNSESILALFGLPVEADRKLEIQILLDHHQQLTLAPVTICSTFTIGPVKARKSVNYFEQHNSWNPIKMGDTGDTLWTGIKRKPEQEYWAIIKANLDHLIGMDASQIELLLGPPRCSSEHYKAMDYRVGDAQLRFLFVEEKVARFEFRANAYLSGT